MTPTNDADPHVPPTPDADPPAESGPGAAGESSLAEQVAALQASLAATEDRLRRQQADFLNDVARIRRQADERAKFAVQPVVEDLLGVSDALHKAVEGLAGSEHERRVAEGLRLVERELLEVLGRYGVARIDAVGKVFDPSLHEAILEVEGAAAERTVLQVVRPGFTLHGRLVRPVRVVVSKPKTPAPTAAPRAPDGPPDRTPDDAPDDATDA